MHGPVKIYFASSNQGKLAEFRTLAESAAAIDSSSTTAVVEMLPRFDSLPPFEENAPTFGQNALGKVLYYSQLSDGIVFADDSGLVVPALGGAPGDAGSLVIKVDAHTTSIAILDKRQLLLFRTLENGRGVTISGEQLAEDVYPSVVFFQDTYATNIEAVYVAGISDIAGAAPALRAQTGAEVKELVRASQLGLGGGSIPKWRMAGVVGALLS